MMTECDQAVDTSQELFVWRRRAQAQPSHRYLRR